MRTIGDSIRILRENRKWTKKKMSDLLGGISYTTISKWESGENHPKGREIKGLCELFNVSADYLLGLDNQEKHDSYNYYKYYPFEISSKFFEDYTNISENEIKWLTMQDDIMGSYSGMNDIFFVDIAGNSMNKTILPGSKIGVKPLKDFRQLRNEDILIFSKDNDFHIRRFYNIDFNKVLLRAESTDDSHIDMLLTYKELMGLELYGKIILTIAKY